MKISLLLKDIVKKNKKDKISIADILETNKNNSYFLVFLMEKLSNILSIQSRNTLDFVTYRVYYGYNKQFIVSLHILNVTKAYKHLLPKRIFNCAGLLTEKG